MSDEINRLAGLNKFNVQPGPHTVESYIAWIKQNALFFDAPYQRPYVWKKKQQQEFLETLLAGFPVGSIAIAKHTNWLAVDGPWLEVVDGKQRLMTLQKFIRSEIPFLLNGKELYWDELNRSERGSFNRPYMPLLTLVESSPKEILEYFIAVNFKGVPQSNKHKAAVMAMRENHES